MRRRALLLPTLATLVAGALWTWASLETAGGERPWARVGAPPDGGFALGWSLIGLTLVSLAGALLALGGEHLSGADRLLGTGLAAVPAIAVSPEAALGVVLTAAAAVWHRRVGPGRGLGLLTAPLASAAALGCGLLVMRAFVDGSGLLAQRLPRLGTSVHLAEPARDVLVAAGVLPLAALATALVALGPRARRVGAVLFGLLVLGSAWLVAHDAPWTHRWGHHVNTLGHVAFGAVLVAGLRALTGWSGRRGVELGDFLACCQLALLAGLVLDQGASVSGGMACVLLFALSLQFVGARERNDLRWRKPRRATRPEEPPASRVAADPGATVS